MILDRVFGLSNSVSVTAPFSKALISASETAILREDAVWRDFSYLLHTTAAVVGQMAEKQNAERAYWRRTYERKTYSRKTNGRMDIRLKDN